MKKGLRTALIIILAGVFVFSGIKLVSALREYKIAEDIYSAEREAVFHIVEYEEPTSAPSVTSTPEAADDPEETEDYEYFPKVNIDFDALLETNPEVIGWIWIPATNVSYPLVRADDNDKYLHRTYNSVYNSSGSIFMDYRNSAQLTDMNSIIYGHNMNNGAMFGKLKRFTEQEYFEENRYVYIFTPELTYKYEIFSAYVTTAGSESYTFPVSEDELQGYIDYAVSSSAIESDTVPAADDTLIMLSTCTSRISYERFVVHAVLIGTDANLA